jgi:3-hydroxyacyl-CoA dehydrogenase/enoyl-CoA hydratase/3-hydroxybutyryl-CoA epimerase/enoyl-CoA isomerase
MMLPMIFESFRCLDDKIVTQARDLDLGSLYGLGFPPFRGGIMSYAESVGGKQLLHLAQKYEALGPLYHAPTYLKQLVQEGRTLFS